MPCADYLACCCNAPRGAGGTVITPSGQIATPESIAPVYDPWAIALPPKPPEPPPPPPTPEPYEYTKEGPPMEIHVMAQTPPEFLQVAETDYPVGTIARLFAPMEADRGLWVAPRLVDTFRKTSNGRWTSYPGNDISYPTLAALAMAAPVMDVILPPPQQTYTAPPSAGEEGPQITFGTMLDDVAGDVPPAPQVARAAGFPWLAVGVAALGVLFLLRK